MVVGPRDPALLPLPLHHAYPFVVGMLTTLTLGTTIVLPGGTTGPSLMRALHDGKVTTIIGVPRLYEALWAAIEARLKGYSLTLRLAFRTLLRLTIFVQQSSGLRLGCFLFAPIRHGIAPHLRLLVSGGARLERETEEQLEALGLMVLSGYGLAETASLFTGNRLDARRPGSVGRPLADGEVRIADPDEGGSARSSCTGARSRTGTSTIPKPTARRSRPTDGTGPATWALSIAMVSCSSRAASRRSWCWAAARRRPLRIWSGSTATRPKSPRWRCSRTGAHWS